MFKKNLLMLFAVFLFAALHQVEAQEDAAFKAPIITDEMTVDAEQNKDWREGNYKYSAKPKNMWEIGLHAGHFQVNGDVPSSIPSGLGVGLHIRKAINYAFSVRLDGMYYSTKGLDGRISSFNVLNRDNNHASLGQTPLTQNTFRAFKSTGISGSIEGIINVGNILFHKERNKWNLYLGVGVALTNVETKLDFRDGSGNQYDFSGIPGGVNGPNDGDKRSAINDILDGEYETLTENDRNVGFLFDNGDLLPSFVASIGVSRKLSKRINITLEHKAFLQDYDKWDGAEYRTTGDQTNDSDQGHYTNLRLGLNLGSFDNRTEPLYWLNPLDGAMNDIASLKMRPELDLTDTDADGVIDMLDQEETEAGCPVDTRGVALDSDGDGLIDCKDKEVYSPPGFEIDEQGVHIRPEGPAYLTEPEIANMINDRVKSIPTPNFDWFLPMVHFDLDKYYIKPEFHSQLHHVATVMRQHPNLRVTAYGHTDNRLQNDYNNVLSYKRAKAAIDYLVANYGVARDRFVLRYGGETTPLIGGLKDSHAISRNDEFQQYMNRRVEFSVASGGETDMGRPAGPDAGKNTPSSSRPGTKYSGNRNSGY